MFMAGFNIFCIFLFYVGHGYIFGFFTLDGDEPIVNEPEPEFEDEPSEEIAKDDTKEHVEQKPLCNGSVTQPELIPAHGLPHPVPMMTMGMQPQGMYVPVYSMYPGLIRPSHGHHPGIMQPPMGVLPNRPQTNIMVPPPPITQTTMPNNNNIDSISDSANKPRRNKKRRPPDYYEKAAKLEREQAQHVQRFAAPPPGIMQSHTSPSQTQVHSNQNIIQTQTQRSCNTVPAPNVYNNTAVQHNTALNGPYGQGQEYGIPGSAFHVYQGTTSPQSCDTNIYQGQMNINISHIGTSQVNLNQPPPPLYTVDHKTVTHEASKNSNIVTTVQSLNIHSGSPPVPSGDASYIGTSDSDFKSAAINLTTNNVPSTTEHVQTSSPMSSSSSNIAEPSKPHSGANKLMSKGTENIETDKETAQDTKVQFQGIEDRDFTPPAETSPQKSDVECDIVDSDKISSDVDNSESKEIISTLTEAVNNVTLESPTGEKEADRKEENGDEIKQETETISFMKDEQINTVESKAGVAPVKKTWAGLFSGTASSGISYNVSPQLPLSAGFPKLGQESKVGEEEANRALQVTPSQPVPAEKDVAARQLAGNTIVYMFNVPNLICGR